jgi:hypothetical protein
MTQVWHVYGVARQSWLTSRLAQEDLPTLLEAGRTYFLQVLCAQFMLSLRQVVLSLRVSYEPDPLASAKPSSLFI